MEGSGFTPGALRPFWEVKDEVNRLICRLCNENLAGAARMLGVDEAKRWHDVYHRLQHYDAANTVVDLARKAVIHLPDDRGDALRRALLDLDQLSKGFEPGYLQYDFGDGAGLEGSRANSR